MITKWTEVLGVCEFSEYFANSEFLIQSYQISWRWNTSYLLVRNYAVLRNYCVLLRYSKYSTCIVLLACFSTCLLISSRLLASLKTRDRMLSEESGPFLQTELWLQHKLSNLSYCCPRAFGIISRHKRYMGRH